jgi:pyruvate formate lyase activating enzyme
VKVDGESADVPEDITVLDALKSLGYVVSRFPGEGEVFAPCRLSGCWACAVIIDGELEPSCTTAVKDSINIQTVKHEVAEHTPPRLVSGFQGHSVGGVGTPYWIKPKGRNHRYIEVASFAHGCILRRPTCQNWEITYSSVEEPLTPNQAARMMTRQRRAYGVDRMAISGGECTLNRIWLIEYLKELRGLNRGEEARFHVDTNAVILAPDYNR